LCNCYATAAPARVEMWMPRDPVDLDIDMQTLISRNGAHNLIKNMRLDFGMSPKVRV
jgi:hypothetical protein